MDKFDIEEKRKKNSFFCFSVQKSTKFLQIENVCFFRVSRFRHSFDLGIILFRGIKLRFNNVCSDVNNVNF